MSLLSCRGGQRDIPSAERGASTIVIPRDHSGERGGKNFASNYDRPQGTRDSDHGHG